MSHTQSEPDAANVLASPGEAISHIEPDDIGVGMLTVLFAFCAVAILLIVVLLQAWFYNWKVDLLAQRVDETVLQDTPAEIAQMQRERIETYGWVDPKTRKDRAIPISRAMEIMAVDLAAQPAGAGKEVGGK